MSRGARANEVRIGEINPKKRSALLACAALIGLFVILTGLSYVIGRYAEYKFHALLAAWSNDRIRFSVTEYHRGVFMATARTEVSFLSQNEDVPQALRSVLLEHQIFPGPLMSLAFIHVKTHVVWADNLTMTMLALAQELPDNWIPFRVDSRIGWLGGQTHHIVSEKGEITDAFGKFLWGGANGVVEIGSRGASGKVRLDLGGFSLIFSENDRSQMERFKLNLDWKNASDDDARMLVRWALSLDAYSSKTADETGQISGIDVSQLSNSGQADVKGGTFNLDKRLAIGRVFTTGEDGDETIHDARLSLVAKNLDVRVLDILLPSWGTSTDATDDERVAHDDISALSKRSSVLSIRDASGQWSEGPVRGSLHLNYLGGANLAEGNLFDNIDFDLKLQLPRALLARVLGQSSSDDDEMSGQEGDGLVRPVILPPDPRQIERRIDNLVARGLLIDNNNSLSIDAQYKARELNVNGRPAAFYDLLGILMFDAEKTAQEKKSAQAKGRASLRKK